jgi:hypothetical protein
MIAKHLSTVLSTSAPGTESLYVCDYAFSDLHIRIAIKIQMLEMTCVLMSAGRIEGDVQIYQVPGQNGTSHWRMHVLTRSCISFSPHVARAH